MPTDRHDSHGSRDRELSRRLRAIEPPRSPAHLDEAILNAARRRAGDYRARHESARPGRFGKGWRMALAAASVGAIAVSISVQLFDEPAREIPVAVERAMDAATRPVPLESPVTVTARAEPAAEARRAAGAQPGAATDAVSNADATAQLSALAEQVEADQAARDIDANSSAASVDAALSASARAAAPGGQSAATAVQQAPAEEEAEEETIEEVIVTGNFVRDNAAFSSAAQSPAAFSDEERLLLPLALTLLPDWRELDTDAARERAAQADFAALRERILQRYQQLPQQEIPAQRYLEVSRGLGLPADEDSLPAAIAALRATRP